MKTNWHVATAAEAIAAAQFARLGFDVSVQYGAGQPEYDLIVSEGEHLLKISVKGSKTGSWGLSQSHLREANYHQAAESWLARFNARTVLCFVQFKNTELEAMPRIYLALPSEVARRLREARGGIGATILCEDRTRGPKGAGAGTVERIPDSWKLTEQRVRELLKVFNP